MNDKDTRMTDMASVENDHRHSASTVKCKATKVTTLRANSTCIKVVDRLKGLALTRFH